MTRDSEQTRTKIKVALGKLLAEKGCARVGVNAVARQAGVDKVLIYRYFGGLPQLVRAFAEEGDFWPTMADLIGGPGQDLRQASISVMLNHLAQLRARPITQEIMRWELLEKNEITKQLAEAREETTGQFLDQMGLDGRSEQVKDFMAVAAIGYAGLTYLVLRSKTADTYMGLDLTSKSGWQRLERATREMVESLLDRLERKQSGKGEDQ